MIKKMFKNKKNLNLKNILNKNVYKKTNCA